MRIELKREIKKKTEGGHSPPILQMLFEKSVPLKYALTNPAYRSVTVDKTAGIFAKRTWQPYFPPSYVTGMRAKSESSKPWLSNVKALRRSRESNYVTFHIT